MSYGLETYTASGVTSFTSDTKAYGIYDVFFVAGNNPSGGSKAYPELAGDQIEIQFVNNRLAGLTAALIPYSYAVSYSSGYPVVSWSLNYSFYIGGAVYPDEYVYVILKTRVASGYGFEVTNSDLEVVSSDISSNYKYIGQATVTSNYQPIVYVDWLMSCTITTSNGVPVVFIENLEGQLTSIANITTSGSTYTITINKTGSSVPRIFCFEKANVTPTGYGLALYNASSTLLMDTTNNLLAPKCFCNSVIPSTAISNGNSPFYTLPSTSLLTPSGTIPSSVATCMTPNAMFGAVVTSSGYNYFKDANLSVKKQSGSLYTGWTLWNWRQFVYYRTIYPFLQNSSVTFRIYSIDISQYT